MSNLNTEAKMPIALTLEEGVYYRCTCGNSEYLPFCDGHHQGADALPIRFEVKVREKVYLCSCGQTKNQPYCDGCCGVDLADVDR